YSGIRLARKLNMPVSEHTMENNQEQRDFYDALSKYISQYGDRLSGEDRLFFTNLLNARKPSNNDAYEALIQQATNILETDDRLKSTKDYLPLTDSEKNKLVAIQEPRNFSPLEVLKYFEILHEFLCIHSVWPQQEDIEIMKANGVSISHNPESNMYLSSGLAPIQDYLRAGLTVSLGTDGAASNDAIDFFSAMKAMWNIAKIRILEIPASSEMNEWTVLQAATINGAKALKLDANTGSLGVGKEADITLISLEELGMAPARTDSITGRLLIYSASPKNIKYVLSDGRVIVENGKLKKYSEQKLSNDLTSIAKKVDQRIATGKLWKDNYTLRTFAGPYLYKYRSIRIKDSVNINFFNLTKDKVKLSIMSSGLVFSGGSPYVVNNEVSSRFPEDPLAKAFKREISLENKQGVQIRKSKNSWVYTITVDGQSTSISSDRGQLLILCEPIKK
ncbi:MAG TPA: amidohydrolase family protein, partial [Chitinophagaceae bacterium]|nr:amidohydrolase family protein [Chitinophagaceae bacterium]